MKMLRTAIGFIFTPFAPALLVAIIVSPLDGAFITIFAFPAVLLLGVPAHLILLNRRWHSWSAYVAAGFIVGTLSEILYRVYISCVPVVGACSGDAIEAMVDLAGDPIPLLLVAYLGAIGALAFWFIVRPDRRHT